jgi:hypothetical protein
MSGMPSHLKNILEIRWESRQIYPVCSSAAKGRFRTKSTIPTLGRPVVAPMPHTHPHHHHRPGWAGSAGCHFRRAAVVCQWCANYKRTSGKDVHGHKDVQPR